MLDVGYDTLLSPSVAYRYDFDVGDGWHSTFGLAHEVDAAGYPFTVGTNLFYQRGYYEQTGIPSWEFGISAAKSFRPMTLAPSISYFHTWENGDFTGEAKVPSTWLFALNVSSGL